MPFLLNLLMQGGSQTQKLELSEMQKNYLQTLLPRGYCLRNIEPQLFEEKRSRKPKKIDQIYQSDYLNEKEPTGKNDREQSKARDRQQVSHNEQQTKEKDKQCVSHPQSTASKPIIAEGSEGNQPKINPHSDDCSLSLVNKRASRYSRGKSKSLSRPAPERTSKQPPASRPKKKTNNREQLEAIEVESVKASLADPINDAQNDQPKINQVELEEQKSQQMPKSIADQSNEEKRHSRQPTLIISEGQPPLTVEPANKQLKQQAFHQNHEIQPLIEQSDSGSGHIVSNQDMLLRFVGKLKSYKASWPFRQPVDPVSQGVPNYLEMIKYPMDLRTIEKKVVANRYDSFGDFKCDVSQILLNSYKFNPKETKYFTLTVQLEDYYHKLLEETQCSEWSQKIGKAPDHHLSEGMPPIEARKNNQRRPKTSFNLQERIRIGQKIGYLDSDSLQHVLLMICQSEGRTVPEDQMAFNINLQKLSEETLRRLDLYFLLRAKDGNFLPEDC